MKRTLTGLVLLLTLMFSGTAYASEVTGQLTSASDGTQGSEVGGTFGGGGSSTGTMSGTVSGGSSTGSGSSSSGSSSGGGSTATPTGSVLGASTGPGNSSAVVAVTPSDSSVRSSTNAQTSLMLNESITATSSDEVVAIENTETDNSGLLAAAGAAEGMSGLWFWLLPLLIIAVLVAIYLWYRSSRDEENSYR